MSLEKVAANRRNAQRSTGPCTPEGKRILRELNFTKEEMSGDLFDIEEEEEEDD